MRDDQAEINRALLATAHHFDLATPVRSNILIAPLVLIFDKKIDEQASLKQWENSVEEQATQIASLLRQRMPQGVRDRLAHHLMRDVLSLFVHSQEGLER